MRLIGIVREAAWLHRARATAYGRMLAAGMALALSYHWLSLYLGHHPGVASVDPGKPGATDFVAFWVAGRVALAGHVAQAWSLAALGPAEHRIAALDAGAVLAFFYPPTFLLLCLPFAALPYVAGFAAFVAAQSAALLLLLKRILPPSWGWLPVLSFPGLLLNAATGQNGFISAACLAVPVLLLERRPWLSGAALGGLAFKPHLALCVPVALLAARRWQAFCAAGLSASAFAAAAWLVLGGASYRAFFASLPAVRDTLEHQAVDWGKLQGAFTAARLCGASLGAAYVAHGAVAVCVMAALALVCQRRPGAGGGGRRAGSRRDAVYAAFAGLRSGGDRCAAGVAGTPGVGFGLAAMGEGGCRVGVSVAAGGARDDAAHALAAGPLILLGLFVGRMQTREPRRT